MSTTGQFRSVSVRHAALSKWDLYYCDTDGSMLPVNRVEPYTQQQQETFRVGVHGKGDIFLHGDNDDLYEKMPDDVV